MKEQIPAIAHTRERRNHEAYLFPGDKHTCSHHIVACNNCSKAVLPTSTDCSGQGYVCMYKTINKTSPKIKLTKTADNTSSTLKHTKTVSTSKQQLVYILHNIVSLGNLHTNQILQEYDNYIGTISCMIITTCCQILHD